MVTTYPEFISLPVAGSVRIVPNGIAFFFIKICFCKMSIGFPSKLTAAEMNLTPSITEPPPTAKIKSIFSAFIISTAFIKVSKCGFGSIPENSTISNPLRLSITCW